jgi:hypothetical protein
MLMARLQLPPFEREDGPWPFPEKLTKTICLVAGREASAALHIALGKYNGASAAHQAIYYEPFTYWDWHGVHPDDIYARDWKRQRFWEHARGFVGPEKQAWGYPTSRERWARFKGDVEKNGAKKWWVKRIAVAHWMDEEDLVWIATHLTGLEGLDLSDIPTAYDYMSGNPWVDLTWNYPKDAIGKSETPSLNLLIWDLLARLTWIGLPDGRGGLKYAERLFKFTLPKCTSLRTLSIRENLYRYIDTDPHQYVSRLPGVLARHVPKSVTTLELRIAWPFLDKLRDALKEHGSNITNIGIDLGAWIQEFPKQEPLKIAWSYGPVGVHTEDAGGINTIVSATHRIWCESN